MPSRKIVIIGCGLSGMITALSLSHHGIKTIVLEKKLVNKDFFNNDLRVTAFTDSSQRFLAKIGFWPTVAQYSGLIKDVYVVDNKSPNMIHFGAREQMGYTVENNRLKSLLLSAVLSNPLIKIIDNVVDFSIKNNNANKYPHIILDNHTKIEAEIIIFTGKNYFSLQHHYFGSDINKDYNQSAITFIVRHQLSHNGTAVEHFLPTGPFAILPLYDQYLSSVVWTISTEMAQLLISMPSEELCYLVQENFGPFLGNIELYSSIAKFALQAYLAKNYVNNRMILVADAAHIIHPLAGQGLNQGIKDIDNLLECIISGEQSFKQYEEVRSADNKIMFEITDNLNKLFSNHSQLLFHSRQLGFNFIEKLPLVKSTILDYAMGKR
jgi:2-octaprenyl-6-methoxyphenol hydroxylase